MPRHNSVRICPDCGGILQPTGIEALTSSEVAAAQDDGPAEGACQCLLCGYIARCEPEGDPEPEPC